MHPLEVWMTDILEEEKTTTVWRDNDFSYPEWTEGRVHVPMEPDREYYVYMQRVVEEFAGFVAVNEFGFADSRRRAGFRRFRRLLRSGRFHDLFRAVCRMRIVAGQFAAAK